MRTYLECIPCFFKQALEAARIAGADESLQKRILSQLAKKIPDFSLATPPAETGQVIYALVKKLTRKQDPFIKLKEKSNRLALKLYPELKKKVSGSKNRLLMAVELAIAGNIIDYGVKNSLDVNKELTRILNEEHNTIRKRNRTNFHYSEFECSLKTAKRILYLADNAGETVFDRILIEEIKRLYPDKEIIYAVKDKPIINDALIEDALICGIDKVAKIISCGSDAPGAAFSLCSKEFLKIYREANMIISKGQGNFECLSEEKRKRIFFLFMAKCPVVANEVRARSISARACTIGDMILLCSHKGRVFAT